MERIFVFEAVNKNGIYGYTRQDDGKNLPLVINNQSITWKAFRILDIQENEPPRIGLNKDEMIESINNNGFYINQIIINTDISF